MQKILFSKIAIIVLIIIVVYAGFQALRQFHKRSDEVDKLDQLKSEIAALQNSNSDLVNLIKYLQSPDFAEEEARAKLNMQKPGEHVVVIPQVAGDSAAIENSDNHNNKNNPALWFNYFFGEKPGKIQNTVNN